MNVNGINGKAMAIKRYMNAYDVDMMILMETWLRKKQKAPISGTVLDMRIEETGDKRW